MQTIPQSRQNVLIQPAKFYPGPQLSLAQKISMIGDIGLVRAEVPVSRGLRDVPPGRPSSSVFLAVLCAAVSPLRVSRREMRRRREWLDQLFTQRRRQKPRCIGATAASPAQHR